MMNKKLIGLLLALCIPLTALADMDDAPHVDSGKRVERMTKELGLNDEQKTKVTVIFDAQREKIKALHEEMTASLKGVLTPEQFTKFEANKEKRKEAHKQKMSGKK